MAKSNIQKQLRSVFNTAVYHRMKDGSVKKQLFVDKLQKKCRLLFILTWEEKDLGKEKWS